MFIISCIAFVCKFNIGAIMCSMIRTAVALILLALSFAQAAKAEPTLEEAIQFIERNVHSIDGTGGETSSTSPAESRR